MDKTSIDCILVLKMICWILYECITLYSTTEGLMNSYLPASMYLRWCTLLSTLSITSYSWIVRSNRTLMNRSVCRRCRNGPTEIIQMLINAAINETMRPRVQDSMCLWFNESIIPWLHELIYKWFHYSMITWLHWVYKFINQPTNHQTIWIKCWIILKWKLTHMKKIQHLFLRGDDRDESILH